MILLKKQQFTAIIYKQNLNYSTTNSTQIKHKRWCSNKSTTTLEREDLLALLEVTLKSWPNPYGIDLFRDLNIKWKFLNDSLENKKNPQDLQKEIETEAQKQNLMHHKKKTKQNSWKITSQDHKVVQEYLNPIIQQYDPQQILETALAEVYIYNQDILTSQTSFIFQLYRQFHKVYNNLNSHQENFKPTVIQHTEKEQFNLGEFFLKKLIALKIVEQRTKKNRFNKKDYYIVLTHQKSIHAVNYKNLNHICMVCPPKNWENKQTRHFPHLENEKEQTIAVNGGHIEQTIHNNYLYSTLEEELNPKVIYGSNTMYLQYSELALQNINYVQQTAFEINKKELHKIIKNLETFLEDYEKIKIYKYKTLNNYAKETPKPEDVSEENHYKMLEITYKTQILALWKIITELYLSIIFLNRKIYFIVYADWRGRVYRKGWPLNPQGSFLSKLLLILAVEQSQNLDKKTIRLDAIASGFSIYGLLTGDKKLLKNTNLLNSTRNKTQPQDFYLFVLKHLEKTIPFIKKLKKYTGEKIITRDFLKQILIPLMYNQGIYGTSKTINETLFLEKTLKEQLPEHAEPVFFFAGLLRREIENCFPAMHNCKKLINTVIDHSYENNKSLILLDFQIQNLIETRMFYPELEKQQIRLNYLEDQKTAYIKKTVEPRKLNKTKSKTAAPANFIQALDATIMLLTVNELRLKKIPVSTVHDCFLISKCFEQETQNAYKNAIITILEKSYLKNLIEKNVKNFKELENPEITSFLKKTSKDKSQLLKMKNVIFNQNPLKIETYQFL